MRKKATYLLNIILLFFLIILILSIIFYFYENLKFSTDLTFPNYMSITGNYIFNLENKIKSFFKFNAFVEKEIENNLVNTAEINIYQIDKKEKAKFKEIILILLIFIILCTAFYLLLKKRKNKLRYLFKLL